MTPEQTVAAVKAALAEAGYPTVRVHAAARGVRLSRNVPLAVAWRVGVVVLPGGTTKMACYPCYEAADGRGAVACTHDTWDGAPPVVRPEVDA